MIRIEIMQELKNLSSGRIILVQTEVPACLGLNTMQIYYMETMETDMRLTGLCQPSASISHLLYSGIISALS